MADLSLSRVDSVEVTPDGRGYLSVEVSGADADDVLSDLSVEEVSSHFGQELVDYIKEEHKLVEEQ